MLLYYGESDDLNLAKDRILEPGDKFHIYRGLRHQMVAVEPSELFEFSTQHFEDDSYRVIKGTKLYLLVGGRGTRLASVTNGKPKPLVDIQEQSFLDIVLDNLSGFDVTLICSDLNYEYFKTYRRSGYEVFNEGIPSGTGGFLRKVNLPDSFYVMNGDTFFSGDLNLIVMSQLSLLLRKM